MVVAVVTAVGIWRREYPLSRRASPLGDRHTPQRVSGDLPKRPLPALNCRKGKSCPEAGHQSDAEDWPGRQEEVTVFCAALGLLRCAFRPRLVELPASIVSCQLAQFC
jgi:hypothetical protein